MKRVTLILIFTILILALACANPEPPANDAPAGPGPELEAERAKVEALEAERATLSEEIASLRAAMVEGRANQTDEADMKIAELEGRLEGALEVNDLLTAEITALEDDFANLADAHSQLAGTVDPEGFSESDIIADLCYSSSLSAYTVSAVARVLAPDVTDQRFNSALIQAGDDFGRAYPHSRLPEYVSLTKWTYCTIPYFDEAHHERMRQMAQDRVDALNR